METDGRRTEMNYRFYGEIESYQATPEKHGRGTFYFTDCGNRMYSVKDDMAYHGKLCPKCGRTLYIRGSKELKGERK